MFLILQLTNVSVIRSMSPWVTEVELTVNSTVASCAVAMAHDTHMAHAPIHARIRGVGTRAFNFMTYQSFSMSLDLPLPCFWAWAARNFA